MIFIHLPFSMSSWPYKETVIFFTPVGICIYFDTVKCNASVLMRELQIYESAAGKGLAND